jgi:regulator of protease activity HflC (stomatin/prohibitin superfamily)
MQGFSCLAEPAAVLMCVDAQGLKLRAGESLVSMTVLPPALAEQVKAEQAAAKAEAATEDGEDAAAEGADAADAAAAEGSSTDEGKGPWLLLITRRGTGKRVLLSGIQMKQNRGAQGIIGIKFSAGRLLSAQDRFSTQLCIHTCIECVDSAYWYAAGCCVTCACIWIHIERL